MNVKKEMNNIIRQVKLHNMQKWVLNTNHSSVKISEKEDWRKFGFSTHDSQIYNFKRNNYHEYITTWESWQPKMQENPYYCISDDKYLFSLVFGKYIEVAKTYALINNGNIEPIEEHTTDNTLYDFILNVGGVVIKERSGFDGFGVYVLRVKENKVQYKNKDISAEEINSIVKKFNRGIIQSIVTQGDFENAIFPNSINTIRIISVKKLNSSEHEIIGALQRTGTNQSAPVDNFCQGGGSTLIDLDTGVLGEMSTAISFDEAGNRVFYEKHPDTGAKIKGQTIPHWQELKQTIINITKKLPFFDFIAWDVVLKNDGFALIETNMKSSLDLFQIHGGMRNSLIGEKYSERGWLVDSKKFK